MQIKYSVDVDAYDPVHGHKADAGFDLKLPNRYGSVRIPMMSDLIVDTGVHFEIPEGYVGFIKSKSGLNVNKGIVSEGVIDAGYTGSVVVKLYNHGDSPVDFNPGDKITQIVFLPIPSVELHKLSKFEKFNETERGTNGFGSTGR